MKKSFYFALALTAGLFASCSSDDLTAEAPQQGLEINDADLVPIQIGVANAGATVSLTRGTGTVGTSEGGTSRWLGQEFQLFMFEKGTLIPGSSDGTEDGVVFCDSTFTTNTDGSGSTSMLVNNTAFQAYYPATGSFDFWAYRLDDAKAGDPTGVATYAAATGWTDNENEVKVPFVIDGTQDIMVGAPSATQITADVATLRGQVTSLTDVTAEEKLYSAYSARRSVNPSLSFQHLLTRLHFAVKPSVKKVSSSDNTYGAPGDPGDNKIPATGFTGFRVDSIWVYSKSEGNLIAAYKSAAAPASRIEWTKAAENWADYNTLKPMYLKERSKKVQTPEVGQFETTANFTVAANGAGDALVVTYSGTIHEVDNSGTRTPNGTDKIYGSTDKNSVTGKPINCIGTLQDKVNEFIATIDADGDGTVTATEIGDAVTAGTLPYTPAATFRTYYVTTAIAYVTPEELDVTVPLQDLTGQQLIWADPETNYWQLETKAHYNAAASAAKEQFAVNTNDFNEAITNLGNPSDVEVTAGLIRMLYVELGTNTVYDEGEDFVLGYVKPIKTAAATTTYTGEGVARPIGEALLVAPSTDVDGYTIKIKYSRYRLEGAKLVWATETQTSTIKQGVNFQPGKSHLVTVTLFPDSTPSVEVTDEPWDEGDPFEITD